MKSDDNNIAVVGAARTPFGRFGGALRSLTLPELSSLATVASLASADVPPDEVDEFALGVNFPGSDRSVARQAALRIGIPEDRNAYTVDRACCSSLTAIGMGIRALLLGESRVAVAGGAENLSRVPYFLENMRWGNPLGPIELVDQLVIACPYTGVPRAVQAATESRDFGIGRQEQDEWALLSQQRCSEAVANDRFAEEIVAVDVPTSSGAVDRIARDESPRPDTTIEGLGQLATVNGSATVTAGNAPGLSTGASSVVLMTAAEAAHRKLTPLATVLARAMVSGHPQKITSIPAVAAQRVLDRVGVKLDDVARIEINEAFAAVPLVSTLVLAGGDRRMAERLRERTNVNGGAIALGHPTGATGARLVMTLAFELARRGGGLGLAAICGGIGEGEAVLIRVG